MTANKIGSDLFLAESETVDPGSGGTIRFNKSLATCRLISAGAEARTMADPTRSGAIAFLEMYTDGGDITVTFSTAFTEDGATTFVFSDVGQWAMLKSIRVSNTTFAWRKIADYSIGNLAPADADNLAAFSALTASVAEINQSSDESLNTEIVTTTNVIAAAESGATFYLNAAGGFTSTLPAPALGMRFRFVVKTAPTTAYVITTTSSANIMYGMTEERAGTAGVAGAAKNTFNFVANQAKIADWVEFYSDGTNWYYRGMTDIAAGNTVA